MKPGRSPSTSDASELNTARSLAVLSVPPRSRVLCVNQGDPEVARLLRKRGCDVAAVEVERQSSIFVPPQCASVIAGDVETTDMKRRLAAESFDAILLLDVLGYLRDPSAALAWACEHLGPRGRLIASFGNVTHGAVRMSLLRGTFRYTDAGLLDRARVRFFDQRTAETLLLDAGLRIDERLRVTRGLEETEIPMNTSTWPPEVIAELLNDSESFTYEFVFVASHAVPGLPAAGASLAERLQLRVEELEAAGRTSEASATRMRAEADAFAASARALDEQASQDRQRARELEADLNRRQEELHVRQHELRHLQAGLADREAFIAQFRAQASSDRAALDALGAEMQQARALQDAARTETEHVRTEAEQARTETEHARTETEHARTETEHARAEVAALSAQLVHLATEHESARAAQANLATRLVEEHAQLVTANSELERVKADLWALRAHANSAGFRLVNRISLSLRQHERVYAALRAMVRKMASRSSAP